MEHRPAWNFQVKKIAGEENLEEAKRLISDRFLLVGTVERFDEFLVLLGKKLLPFEFDAAYQRKNIAKGDGEWIGAIMDKYESKIREHNELDVKLYQYINDEVLPAEIESYGDMFEEAVRRHMHSNRTSGVAKTKSHVDYLFRKFYCTPVAGLIRKINGLPADGSYGSF
jgi:sRNA-binding regulator protein Hfq